MNCIKSISSNRCKSSWFTGMGCCFQNPLHMLEVLILLCKDFQQRCQCLYSPYLFAFRGKSLWCLSNLNQFFSLTNYEFDLYLVIHLICRIYLHLRLIQIISSGFYYKKWSPVIRKGPLICSKKSCFINCLKSWLSKRNKQVFPLCFSRSNTSSSEEWISNL